MPARKRIALVTQFYSPEPCAASNRLSALAATLAAAGNDVMVVTGFPSFPTGEIPPAYRRRFFVRENVGGIAVARVWTFASERKSRRNRFLNWLSVALGASLYLLLQRARFDVIVVSSPPITLALPALVGKVRHRATLVADIRDVFPDVAVRIGEWREDSTIVRLVAAVAESLYRAANVVVCVTETARDEIAARGVPLEKIAVRPNG
ncbi:MAG: glycosyltransferase, partial [Candidatus Eremiobacteraeota bacterium]|nr:glycosyltransferase [Candidatus Eremiobacteraeota bacterium]